MIIILLLIEGIREAMSLAKNVLIRSSMHFLLDGELRSKRSAPEKEDKILSNDREGDGRNR